MFNNTPKKSQRRINLIKASPLRIICLSFVAVILIGTAILMLPISTRAGIITPFSDALFTATSATCVTGLVLYDTYLHWSFFGQLTILTLIQIGGLGLVTLTSFFSVIVGKRLGFRGMELAKESVNTESFADVKKMLSTVLLVTFVVEFVGAIILGITFIPKYGFIEGGWLSLFLSVSAFCNAGFDLLGREGEFVSLTNYTDAPLVYMTISLLVILGGLGFIVWRELFFYPKTKTISLHSRVVIIMTISLILVGFVSFTCFEWTNPDTMGDFGVFEKVGAGFFQSITTRTAGFNSIDQALMSDQSKILSIALMFVGASPASTGGGMKVTTVAVIFMTIISVFRGQEDTIINNRIVDKKAVYKAMALFFSGITVVIVTVLVLQFTLETDVNTIDIVYETVSAFGTAGLSTGITAQLSTITRYLLVICMYAGRVGPIGLIVSVTLHSRKNKEVLPHGKILIG